MKRIGEAGTSRSNRVSEQRSFQLFRNVILTLIAVPSLLMAQASAPDSSRLDFSGVIFANYQYQAEEEAQSANKFDVERAYLTFRMPAGDRASVRVTTDLYQQGTSGSDAYYRGWSIRAKYAFLQYHYLSRGPVRASARVGLLQTVFIEHDESFWPRWIATSPTDRNGYFSSADAGIANTLSIPAAQTEVYTTITNGPGYTSREIDRFKDFAARITVRPWKTDSSSALRGVAITAWGYKGATASRFVRGGSDQVGSVADALERNRWGIHAGSSSPRLIIAAQFASRVDGTESGENTAESPRVASDSASTLVSMYGIVRPLSTSGEEPHPLSILARIDRVTVEDARPGSYDIVIGGLSWDISSRLSAAVDYQQASPRNGTSIARTRTWFAHFVGRF